MGTTAGTKCPGCHADGAAWLAGSRREAFGLSHNCNGLRITVSDLKEESAGIFAETLAALLEALNPFNPLCWLMINRLYGAQLNARTFYCS